MDPLLLITNADAGGAQHDALEVALGVLREDADVEVATTTNPGELDGVLHRAGCRSIVVAGGDGSLHAVVSALHRRHELAERTLGLIPLGTGNDFARALEIPLDPAEAAAALLAGKPRRMDLIVDELGGVVVNSVHAGASAQASRRGARWKERLGPYGFGILGYPIGAALVLDQAAVRPAADRGRRRGRLRHGQAHLDGRGRQRHQRRRRHRAHPRRGPYRRPTRRDGVVRHRSLRARSATPGTCARPTTRSVTT